MVQMRRRCESSHCMQSTKDARRQNKNISSRELKRAKESGQISIVGGRSGSRADRDHWSVQSPCLSSPSLDCASTTTSFSPPQRHPPRRTSRRHVDTHIHDISGLRSTRCPDTRDFDLPMPP